MDKIKQDSLNVCICGMLNIPSMGSDSADLASSFMLYVQSTSTFNVSDYRELEIGLRSGYLDDIFQQWVLNTPIAFSIKLTRTLQNPERTAKLQYTIYKNYKPSGETLPFYVEDCLGHFNTFVVGESICSYVKGEGWKLLNKLGNMFPDSITVIQAGCLLACDYDAFNKGIIDDPVEKLIRYYNNNEFYSINDVIGNYEESHIMARFMGNWSMYVSNAKRSFWENKFCTEFLPVGAINWCRDNASVLQQSMRDMNLWHSMKYLYHKYGPHTKEDIDIDFSKRPDDTIQNKR